MEDFPNYHPMIVHFPIVLLLLAAAMQLAGFFVKNKGFHYTILAFAVLGYASAYFAAAWRHPQIEREAVSAAVLAIFDEHQLYARWSVYLGGAGAVLKGVELYFRQRFFLVALTALALLGAAAAVAISGHHGAELVHKHGVGPKGEFLKKKPVGAAPAVSTQKKVQRFSAGLFSFEPKMNVDRTLKKLDTRLAVRRDFFCAAWLKSAVA